MSVNKSKARTERMHAKLRAFQRAGVVYTNKDLDNMVLLIRKNKAVLVEMQTNTRAAYTILYNGKIHDVVYNYKSRQIVTFLDWIGLCDDV